MAKTNKVLNNLIAVNQAIKTTGEGYIIYSDGYGYPLLKDDSALKRRNMEYEKVNGMCVRNHTIIKTYTPIELFPELNVQLGQAFYVPDSNVIYALTKEYKKAQIGDFVLTPEGKITVPTDDGNVYCIGHIMNIKRSDKGETMLCDFLEPCEKYDLSEEEINALNSDVQLSIPVIDGGIIDISKKAIVNLKRTSKNKQSSVSIWSKHMKETINTKEKLIYVYMKIETTNEPITIYRQFIAMIY